MSTIIEDDQGNEITVFTAAELEAAKTEEIEKVKAEYEAKLLDKDNHIKEKTDEFLKGKTSQELKDIERDNAIAEARRIAEEATGKVTAAEQRRVDTLKSIARERFTGNDPELNKKFEEAWGLVNLEIADDADIVRKAELVANMSGLNSGNDMSYGGGMAMSGGYAPNFSRNAEAKVKEEDHEQFSKALGLDSFISEVKGTQ